MAANTSPSDGAFPVTITIRDVRVMARIGVYAHEQTARQPLHLHATIVYDGGAAAHSDQLGDALDYQRITRRMCECAESADYDLLEALLDSLLHVVMEDERVSRATVRIDKPNALARAECVSAEASRER